MTLLNSADLVIAFEALKKLFVNKPLLLHFDFDKDRIFHVDSSGYAIAAVLSQPNANGDYLPVSYFSRKLSDRERSWKIFDLELLAIVSACEEWRAWLMGTRNPVSMFSNHSNLLYFKTAKYLSPKQARWALFLDNFNMFIYHIVGSKNPANRPSRREDFCDGQRILGDANLITRRMVSCEDILGNKDISPITSHDLFFQRPTLTLLTYFKKFYLPAEVEHKKDVWLIDNIYWHNYRVFVPSSLRTRIMIMYHDSPAVGHRGIARTFSTLTRTFLWPGVKSSVIQYVNSCDSCQQVKTRRRAPVGKLVPIVADPRPWSVIGMDLIVKLPLSGGFDSILVVIDLLSKLTHFVPCKEASSSAALANLFKKNIFRLHGLPDKIVLDRGSTFVGEFWKALINSLGIKSALSTAYHPQTDG